MNVVLDTSVPVSALWSPDGKPGAIVCAAIAQRFNLCYDHRILEEYERVLRRPKFEFSAWEIHDLLEALIRNGISVVPEPLHDVPFTDESDRKFLEVARFCGAPLVTGNLRHYPPDPRVIAVSEFYERYCR